MQNVLHIIYFTTVPHQLRNGSDLVIVKNLTQLSQLTIGIFKSKKLFLAKKGQLINDVVDTYMEYIYRCSSNVTIWDGLSKDQSTYIKLSRLAI